MGFQENLLFYLQWTQKPADPQIHCLYFQYIEELLRHCSGRNDVSRRSAIVAAGSALQYCGKIYGDRVEYLCQVVEHQIEALLTSELQKETPSGSAA